MMNLQEVTEFATKRNDGLFANDFHSGYFVRVVEEEGSSRDLAYAFFEIHGDWLIVFSEHNPPFIRHRDEVVHVYQYALIKTAVGTGGWGKSEGDWNICQWLNMDSIQKKPL